MKVLIQDNLSAFLDCTDDSCSTEYKEYIEKLMNDFSVYHSFEHVEEGYNLTIPAQKIVIPEWEMNQLFHDVLCYFKYVIEYASLGGEGCDFSIDLYSAK